MIILQKDRIFIFSENKTTLSKSNQIVTSTETLELVKNFRIHSITEEPYQLDLEYLLSPIHNHCATAKEKSKFIKFSSKILLFFKCLKY